MHCERRLRKVHLSGDFLGVCDVLRSTCSLGIPHNKKQTFKFNKKSPTFTNTYPFRRLCARFLVLIECEPKSRSTRRKPKGEGGKGTAKECHDSLRQMSRQFTTSTIYDSFLPAPFGCPLVDFAELPSRTTRLQKNPRLAKKSCNFPRLDLEFLVNSFVQACNLLTWRAPHPTNFVASSTPN